MTQPEIFHELIQAVRQRAEQRLHAGDTIELKRAASIDDGELFKALARLVEGKSVYESFGAPGGWGYGTPIGDALKAAYSRPGSNPNRATIG